jgi:hypothetical protein
LSSFETNNVIPVVCGNFGEVNKTASRLLCVLAKRAAMSSETSELVPSTVSAKHKQRYSFLISEWRRVLSVTITRGFATLKLCRIPSIRSTVASAVAGCSCQTAEQSRSVAFPGLPDMVSCQHSRHSRVPPLRGVSVTYRYAQHVDPLSIENC